MPTLQETQAEIKRLQTEGEDLVKAAEDAAGFTDEQHESLRKVNTQIKSLIATCDNLKERELLVSQFGGYKESIERMPAPMTFSNEEAKTAEFSAGRGLGAAFTDHEAVKHYLKQIAPTGAIGKDLRITTPAVTLPNLIQSLRPLEAKGVPPEALKALVTGASATSAGALFQNFWYGLPDPQGLYQRELSLLDLVTRVPVTGDTVEYVRVGTPTNAAAPVAEATATSGASGAKPESAFPLAVVTETIRSIAHWMPITRRALSDAPMMRQIVNSFLQYGLREELEDQIVTGSGSGENFTGVLNVSGIQTQAYTTDLLTTSRKAWTILRRVGRVRRSSTVAWAMYPDDWEDFDLLTDNEERYYMGGPREMMTPRLWGFPVIENEGVTEGHGILADWQWVTLFDRQDNAVYVTDSHSDFFIRNILAILAEMRAGMGVIRPKAIVDVDLTA
jgi:HK97 family phage major capsid protein